MSSSTPRLAWCERWMGYLILSVKAKHLELLENLAAVKALRRYLCFD